MHLYILLDFFNIIYLFIWLHQILVVACGIFNLCCSMQDVLVVAIRISFPDQGSNADSLPWEH